LTTWCVCDKPIYNNVTMLESLVSLFDVSLLLFCSSPALLGRNLDVQLAVIDGRLVTVITRILIGNLVESGTPVVQVVVVL